MFITSTARAFIRARDEAGLKLPGPVQEAAEHAASIAAQQEALPPIPEAHDAATLAGRGMTLEEAQNEAERLARERARVMEMHHAASEAGTGAAYRLTLMVADHRDELVLSLRPAVDALVKKARPHAARLARFAPAYSAGDIVHTGEAADLKAFQAAAKLERTFGVLIAAWRAAFADARAELLGGFDVRNVAECHRFWARPELVANEALNGTKRNVRGRPVEIAPTLLGIASEPEEAGFRLAIVDELEAVYNAARAVR